MLQAQALHQSSVGNMDQQLFCIFNLHSCTTLHSFKWWCFTSVACFNALLILILFFLTLIFWSIVPTPVITTCAPTTETTIKQLIGCTATTVIGVELDAVQFIWTGPIGNTIVNNTRKTILPKHQHQNNFSSEVLFEYLTEEDKGMYTCTVVILDARVSASLNVAPRISKFSRKWYI